MSDTEDQEFDKAFEGFGEDPAQVTPPAATDDATTTPPTIPPAEPPKEEPKKDEAKSNEEPNKEAPAAEQAPAGDNKEEEKGTESPKDPATPPAGTPEKTETSEEPKPLTKDDVESVVSNLLNTERTSSKVLETATQDVVEAYFPDGLSNVLKDEKTGMEMKSPQDVVNVVAAQGGEISVEEAAKWLMEEQYKLDRQVDSIKSQARHIAEVNIDFRRDAVQAVKKYEPLFTWKPFLQEKIYDLMMKQVKVDKEKQIILSAPDVMDLYDTYLEPYQRAYEFSQGTPATNPTPPPTPEPPKPTAEDRMDEGGDGEQSEVNDPNNFAQQVGKELAKEL